MNGYELSRVWFDWCFVNPEKIKPNHSALYFFAIEHCNRLGWKEKFGLPTSMAMEALGMKSYNTYKDTLTDLVEWGFIKMVEKSKNQYSANIVALSNFNKAVNKALDKALLKHASKQSESTDESIDSIDKPLTNNLEPLTTNNGECEDLNEKKSELISALVDHFDFNAPQWGQKRSHIMQFVNSQMLCVEDIEHFKNQFVSYIEFKKLSKQQPHNFTGYLGTPAMRFENAGWNAENWSEKLAKFKSNPQNKTKFERAADSYNNAHNPYK